MSDAKPGKRYRSIEEIERALFPEQWKRNQEEEQRAKSILPFRISGRVW